MKLIPFQKCCINFSIMLKICITYKYFQNIKQAYFYWNNNIEEEKEGGPLNFVKN